MINSVEQTKNVAKAELSSEFKSKVEYYWETVEKTKENKDINNTDIDPLRVVNYHISEIGLLYLGFSKPIIDPPILKQGDIT